MSFPIEAVRARFPTLAASDNGRPRTYLDNPAGTQVPESVIEAVSRSFREACANLGGSFPTTVKAGAIVEEAHAAMAEFLGAAAPEEIVIGPNMTTLTYQLSRSLGRRFQPGDEIVVTRMDHEGNVSPWLQLAEERGLVVRWLAFDRDSWRIEPAALDTVLSEKTRLLALNYASNLTGSINEVAALAARAKAAGALVAVDAVQFAPHGLVDVRALGCDFLVCSAYKFFGPHLGILWGRADLLAELFAYRLRCVEDALPHRFEPGTPQIELQAGLTAAVEHFAWLGTVVGAAGPRRARITAGYRAAIEHETLLSRRLIDGLRGLPGVAIHGITNPNRLAERVPTVSFTHGTVKPAIIAQALAEDGIFVWSGHNYALEVVRQLSIPEADGVVRIGFAHYNTEADVERTLVALGKVLG